MRIRNRLNHGWAPSHTDPVWAERVEREAEAHTLAAETAYSRAQERLARAEAKLARLQSKLTVAPRRIAVATALVELRRQELLRFHRQMTASPASSQHRGARSYRGVGLGGDPL